MAKGMISNKTLAEIAKTLNPQYAEEYDYIGMRVQDGTHGAQVGEVMTHQSLVWVDGDMTNERLTGVCAIDAQLSRWHNSAHSYYIGDTVLILGSDRAEYGEDDGEIVMRDPIVLHIIHYPAA